MAKKDRHSSLRHSGAPAKALAGNAHDALDSLLDEQKVDLRKRSEFPQLIKLLGKRMRAAQAQGLAVPDVNLADISIGGVDLLAANLGIPRNHMPQLSGIPTPGSHAAKAVQAGTLEPNRHGSVNLSAQFLDQLERKGIEVDRGINVRPSELLPTQSQIDGGKVADLMRDPEKAAQKAILISSDGFIVDGHHHWATVLAEADKSDKTLASVTMKANRVHLPIRDLLKEADAFVRYWGIPPQDVGFQSLDGQ